MKFILFFPLLFICEFLYGLENGENIQVEEEILVEGESFDEQDYSSLEEKRVVKSDEINESGATDLGEVMNRQLGVQVNAQSFRNRGAPEGIQIQGCDPRRVLILVDGKKVIGSLDGIVDSSQIPLDNVEKIEIVKGSSSALYGSDAICGVVNIFTKQVEDGLKLRGKTEYGSYNARQAALGLRYRIDDSSTFRVDGAYRGGDGYDMDKSTKGTDGDAFDSFKLSGRYDNKVTDKLKLSFDSDLFYEKKDGISSFKKDSYTEKEYISDTTKTVIKPGASLRAEYSINDTDKIEFKVYNNFYKRTSKTDLRDSPEEEERTTHNNFFNSAISAGILVGDWNLINVGVAFDHETLDDKQEGIAVVDGNEENNIDTSRSNIKDKKTWNYAFFLQDEMTPYEWMTSLVGIRLSYNKSYFWNATPKLSFEFTPNNRLTLRLSYGMGYKTPTLKHLYYTFEHTIFGNKIAVSGNPDLKPEKSHSFNASAELKFNKNKIFRLNGYYNKYHDFIDVDYDNPDRDGADAYYTYRNISKARTYGLESEVSISFLDLYTFTGGYVLLFAENEDDDTTLPHRPKHQVKARFRFNNKKIGIVASISGMYQSSVYTDSDNDIESSQFFLLHSYLEKRVSKGVRVYLRGSNLTDVKRDASDSDDMRPQPGIEIFGGVNFDCAWN